MVIHLVPFLFHGLFAILCKKRVSMASPLELLPPPHPGGASLSIFEENGEGGPPKAPARG